MTQQLKPGATITVRVGSGSQDVQLWDRAPVNAMPGHSDPWWVRVEGVGWHIVGKPRARRGNDGMYAMRYVHDAVITAFGRLATLPAGMREDTVECGMPGEYRHWRGQPGELVPIYTVGGHGQAALFLSDATECIRQSQVS